MKKFRFNRSTEIGVFMTLFGACIKLAVHLYAVLMSIGLTEAVITNVEYNIYRLKIFTTIEQYEVHILPTYGISMMLIIYFIKLVVDYFKYQKQENKG
ncbi:hypothetical protein [Paenibacillus bouchesdurhonensis]|uniref:hypothetical protein n=1 Tax=Paenibacillus bouchesdurhonensis TaxID=1870990 RepID=UPI000DA62126|nr:hypothetical protein [Paenibacillus bouchesdurhonensis]